MRYLILAWIASAATGALHAQPVTNVKVRPGVLDILTPVTADQSRCVALSEKFRLLAFGHDKTFPEGNVTLVKLNEKGAPASVAETIKLPLPPDLVKAGNHVSSLAFHPKLPRLYVWQEVNVHYNFPITPDPPAVAPFDHLCILDISKSPAELMLSVCRGPDYLYGMGGGGVAVDDDGSFLYIPNIRHTDRSHWAFGRFPLDADGLPKVLDKDMPLPDRLKEIAARNIAKTLVPAEKTPNEYVNAFPGNFAGSVMDAIPLSAEAVVMGGPRGFLLWRPGDQVSPLSMLPLKQFHATMIGRHPKSSAIYATRPGYPSIFRADLAGDVLTTLPRETVLPEKIGSRPVVLPKNRLAVAGPWHVAVLDLDDAGNPRPDAIRIPALTVQGRALVYSPQFDRLYVGVELSK